MQTLHRRQRHAEGGCLRIEQSAARITLHNRDPHILPFADPIQLFPDRRDAAQLFIVGFRKILINVPHCRHHVKSRIDAEQDHFDLSLQRRHLCHLRIVGTDTDMADLSLAL